MLYNETYIQKRYRIPLLMESGQEKSFKGKLLNEGGQQSSWPSSLSVTVHLPFYRTCLPKTIHTDTNGIFAFNLSVLNNSVPYVARLQFEQIGSLPMTHDFYVGGPVQDSIV